MLELRVGSFFLAPVNDVPLLRFSFVQNGGGQLKSAGGKLLLSKTTRRTLSERIECLSEFDEGCTKKTNLFLRGARRAKRNPLGLEWLNLKIRPSSEHSTPLFDNVQWSNRPAITTPCHKPKHDYRQENTTRIPHSYANETGKTLDCVDNAV